MSTLNPSRRLARNAKGQFIAVDPSAAATRAQLQDWTRRLATAQATPLVMVGLGHARRNLGALYILTPNDPSFDRATLRTVLRRALTELDVAHV
jgi:hypothetical protein